MNSTESRLVLSVALLSTRVWILSSKWFPHVYILLLIFIISLSLIMTYCGPSVRSPPFILFPVNLLATLTASTQCPSIYIFQLPCILLNQLTLHSANNTLFTILPVMLIQVHGFIILGHDNFSWSSMLPCSCYFGWHISTFCLRRSFPTFTYHFSLFLFLPLSSPAYPQDSSLPTLFSTQPHYLFLLRFVVSHFYHHTQPFNLFPPVAIYNILNIVDSSSHLLVPSYFTFNLLTFYGIRLHQLQQQLPYLSMSSILVFNADIDNYVLLVLPD